MTRKSICFVTDNDLNVSGGEQRVITAILTQLADHYDITLICRLPLVEGGYYHLDRRVKVIPLDQAPPVKPSSLVAKVLQKVNYRTGVLERIGAKALVRKTRYSKKIFEAWIAYLNGLDFDCVVGISRWCGQLMMQIGAELNARVFSWYHSTYEAYYFTPGQYAYGERLLLEDACQHIEKLIVVTEADAEKYRTRYRIDALCLPNPRSFCSPVKGDPRSKRMAFVGRLVWEAKGLGLLVEVLDQVLPRVPDWEIDIVGDGADGQRLRDMVAGRPWRDQVRFVGETDRVIDYYTRASVLLLTSKWEGFGLVVTEAMECGLPVVSFDTVGPHEIISDGVDGYLIPCYDTGAFAQRLLDLLREEEKRAAMSSNAIEKASRYSIEEIVGQWRTVLGESADDGTQERLL